MTNINILSLSQITGISLIHSPLEQFEVVNLISLNAPIFGYLNIALSNLALYTIIVFIKVS